MNEIIDGTIVSAEVARELTKTFLQKIEGPISKFVNKGIVLHLKGFEPYLAKTYRRCNAVRVLADRDRIYELKDIYVSPTYKCGKETIGDAEIANRIRDGGRIVVQGFGGVGKTILLKHIWVELFTAPEGKVPVFVELRRFNDIKDIDIASYIATVISTVDSPLSVSDFYILMKSGRFTLIFDGFDELSDDRRDVVEGQILSLVAEYPEIGFLISSRSDERFVAWGQFSIYSVQKYTKDDIRHIVDRVQFESVVKRKFIKEILDKEFDRYEDFLSTPLLALMMLLTYRQFADIPEKIHIFYRYAFQTLFSLHDASKEAFKRKRKTNLDEDEFARLFSVFCLMSYIEYDLTFSRDKALDYIDRAKKRTSTKVDSDKFLDECEESVNLLFKDGDMYSFVHRSFQEYFASYSIVNVFSGDVGKILKKLTPKPGEMVLQMAYEMNTDLVESSYFINEYNTHKSFFDSLLSKGFGVGDLLSLTKINWIVLCSKDEGGLLLSLMAPSHQVWDFMRKTQICFNGEALKDGLDMAVIPPRKEMTQVLNKIRGALESQADSSGVMLVGVDIDENWTTNLTFDGQIFAGDELVEILGKNRLTIEDYIEDHLVSWRAQAVFLTRKMREMLRREKARKITLDDIL
jgi:hypothetical protein